eukprot:symbB.v1.2.027225.t3/scaffold2778.1/size70658/3
MSSSSRGCIQLSKLGKDVKLPEVPSESSPVSIEDCSPWVGLDSKESKGGSSPGASLSVAWVSGCKLRHVEMIANQSASAALTNANANKVSSAGILTSHPVAMVVRHRTPLSQNVLSYTILVSLALFSLQFHDCFLSASRLSRVTMLAEGDAEVEAAPSLYITPIGPFSPFRSSACAFDSELGKGMSDLTSSSPEFAIEMGRMQLDMQMGREPDPERMRTLADGLETSHQKWQGLMTRLQLSSDFQSREYFKLSVSHLDGRSIDDLGKMVQYQVDCMRAVASGLMPPAPPVGLDMSPPKGMPSATGSPAMIEAEPFDSSAFTSEVVREEYDVLRQNHRQLIKMGEGYGDFDPLGKLAFLDQVEQIEERWDIFFGRLGLLGQLSPEYRQQSSDFLDSMGLTAQQFRTLLRRAHDLMRQDAEAERT